MEKKILVVVSKTSGCISVSDGTRTSYNQGSIPFTADFIDSIVNSFIWKYHRNENVSVRFRYVGTFSTLPM